MGLVDKVRDQRDSWTRRFEEQRQEGSDSELDNLSEEKQEEIIRQNWEFLGKFAVENQYK